MLLCLQHLLAVSFFLTLTKTTSCFGVDIGGGVVEPKNDNNGEGFNNTSINNQSSVDLAVTQKILPKDVSFMDRFLVETPPVSEETGRRELNFTGGNDSGVELNPNEISTLNGFKSPDAWPSFILRYLYPEQKYFDYETKFDQVIRKITIENNATTISDILLPQPYSDFSFRLTSSGETICYETAKAPFYVCTHSTEDTSRFESFPYFKSTMTRLSRVMKLELCPTGKRLFHLDWLDGLKISFLHQHHTDHMQLLPGLKFIDATIDWINGVLFTLDAQGNLQVWAMSWQNVPELQRIFQIDVGDKRKPVSTCNQKTAKFYIQLSDGSIALIDYRTSSLNNVDLETILPPGHCRWPEHWKGPPFRKSLISDGDYVYCIDWIPNSPEESQDPEEARAQTQNLMQLDTISKNYSTVVLSLPGHGRYTQLALNELDEDMVRTIESACSGCAYRCIPVYMQKARCACPFEQLGFRMHLDDANTSSTKVCVSSDVEMVQLLHTPGASSNFIRHVDWNRKERVQVVNFSSGLDYEARRMEPRAFVPVWNFGTASFFCVKSTVRAESKDSDFDTESEGDEDLYSCHSYHEQQPLFSFSIDEDIEDGQIETFSRSMQGEWIAVWKTDECVKYFFLNSSTPNLEVVQLFTLYCHYELVESVYKPLKIPDKLAVDGQTYTIVFSEGGKLCIVKPGGGNRVEMSWSNKLELHTDFVIRNNLLLHMSADNQYLITTYVEGSPQSFHFRTEHSKIPRSNFQARWLSPTSYCWIEEDEKLYRRYIKCFSWDGKDVQVFMPPSGDKLLSFEVSSKSYSSTSGHPCYNGVNTCSHLCVPKGDLSMQQYSCLCPDELPVNIDGFCTLRLRMSCLSGDEKKIITFNTMDMEVTNIKEQNFRDRIKHASVEIHDPGANRSCYITASSNIQCGTFSVKGQLGSVIAGSKDALFFVRGFTRVFRDEMYWSSLEPVENSSEYRQCFHLGSMTSGKPSICLYCFDTSKKIFDQLVTIDAQRKILFFFEMIQSDVFVRAMPLALEAGSKSDGASVPVSAHSSLRKNNLFDMVFSIPISIACDDTVKQVYTVTYDGIDSTYDIHSIGYNTYPSIMLHMPLRYLALSPVDDVVALVSFSSFLFWCDSNMGLWGKRPTSPRPFLIATLTVPEHDFITPFSMEPTYTSEELKLQSPCYGTKCEFYCQVIETGIKPVAQCLCNDTDGGYQFCDPLRDISPLNVNAPYQELSSNWELPAGITIGVFILLGISANVGGCFYMRKRNKEKMDRIVKGFMDGDMDRANAARNEAEKAEFLPFTAIIKPEDLAVNQVKILGEGNFGTVYEGLFDRKVVAVKTVKSNLDPQVIEDFLKELKITAYVGEHEQIVRFYGAEISRIRDGRVLVVLELCPNGDLLSYIRKRTDWDWCDFEETMEINKPIEQYVSVESEQQPEVTFEMATARYVNSENSAVNLGYEVPIATLDDSASKPVESTIDIEVSNLLDEISPANVAPAPAKRAVKGQDHNYQNFEPSTTAVIKETVIVRLPKECIVWAHQIANGMEYLEHKKVIHGDMAARNILVFSNNAVKISDFGFSRNVYQYETYQKKSACPLPYRWCSPETLSRLEFSSKSDVWSFGVTVWEIFSFGNVPFANMSWDVEFVEKITDRGLRLEKPHSMPQKLYDEILAVCWQVDPAQRPNFTQLRDKLESVLNTL